MDNKLDKVNLIMQNTNINFLLGAGISYNKVKGKVSYPLMVDLLKFVRECQTVKKFLDGIKYDKNIGDGIKEIIDGLFKKYLFGDNSNIENFLSVLEGIDLYIYDEEIKSKINELQNGIKKEIRDRLKISDDSTAIDNYLLFYNGLKWLKEINSIKNQSINIFTTNYDMLNEIAMEKLKIHYYSGFEGIVNREFNLAYYNYNFTDNFNVNKNSIQVNANHINLFKLHGSVSWELKEGVLIERNPYDQEFIPEIIYPSINKFNNTNLIINYSALMRELSNRICQKNTTLIVCGTSMGDEHINKIIENALTINSFNMIILAYSSGLINELKEKYKINNNVIILEESHTFKDLADILLSLQGGKKLE